MSEAPSDNSAADIYRHPFVQSRNNCEDATDRESYKISVDLYSLGIVLLEIARWKTIDCILGIHLDASPRQTRRVDSITMRMRRGRLLLAYCRGSLGRGL